jgi:hypothetical protein
VAPLGTPPKTKADRERGRENSDTVAEAAVCKKDKNAGIAGRFPPT